MQSKDFTIWVFGDSFSEKFSKNIDWSNQYINYKGYIPKVYSDLISDELQIKSINNARGGSDNYSIFESIWDCAEDIKDDDIIIIGWSSPVRFRLYNTLKKDWQSLIPNFNHNELKECNISENTYNEIVVNRTDIFYEKELAKIVKFINFTFKTQKIIYFRWDDMGRLKKYSTISEETKKSILNEHYSEEGHKQLAKDLIYCINNTKRINNLAWFIDLKYYDKIKPLI